MPFALLFALCSAVAAADAPETPAAEVETVARAYRIESYDSAREDRDAYQELRDRDDDLRTALSSFDEATLPARQADAIAWYREATLAVQTGEELPAVPGWLEEGLAAAKNNARKTKEQIVTKNAGPSPTALPPTLAPTSKKAADAVAPVSASNPFGFDPSTAQSGDATEKNPTPFSFVNAMLRAVDGKNSKPAATEPEIKDPVIVPAGPVVDGVDQGPTIELPTLAPNGDAAVEPAKEAKAEPAKQPVEPAKQPAEKPAAAKSKKKKGAEKS